MTSLPRPWGRTVAVLAGLAATNAALHRSPIPDAPATAAGVGLLALGAVGSGLSTHELGLDPTRLREGLRAGALVATASAALALSAAALPPSREWLRDERYPTTRAAWRAALIAIPLTTVLPEELAFRGVLHASLARHLGPVGQVVLGAAAFGAWHVLGAHREGGLDEAVQSWLGSARRARWAEALSTALVTGIAGGALVGLRRHTGSLAAPMLAHWGINAAGALASASARRVARGAGRER